MVRAIVFDYFGVLAHRYGRCDAEMIEFIQEELVGKHKLAVLSNMNSGTAEEMLGEHASLFDVVALSGGMGFGKPDKRAYLEVARLLGEFPPECLMIDDSEMNCRGAEDAGLEAICYSGVETLRPELEKYAILAS